MTVVLEQGIYEMDEATYHADPVVGTSLSATGAKRILEAPAKYHHAQNSGEVYKSVFDFGTAAHTLVLGTGRPLAVIPFDEWRSKDAKQAVQDARDAGEVPIKPKDMATVEAMAEQIRQHPLAVALLDPTKGKAEQSVFWEWDGDWYRARPDFMDDLPRDGRDYLIVVDYKSTPDASTRGFEKSIVNFGYHVQAAHYSSGVTAVTGMPVKFLFIAQEKTAPYLVNVIELSSELLLIGSERMDRAMHVWRECRRTGIWPGYEVKVQRAIAPTRTSDQHEEDMDNWRTA